MKTTKHGISSHVHVDILLPSALARGSESRIYSHKVRIYVSGGSRSAMSRGMSLHTGSGYTIGTRHGPYPIHASHSLTHSDTLDSDIVRCSLVMEMEVGDAGPSRLECYNIKQLLQQIKFANVTRARQRCACVFLVNR